MLMEGSREEFMKKKCRKGSEKNERNIALPRLHIRHHVHTGFQIRTHIKMFRCNRVNGCCIAWWSIFSFLICYYSSYVSPYYEIPVSCDPIIYHLMGRGMMEGLMPYRDLFDQKGPFIF